MDSIDAVLQPMSHSNCQGTYCDDSWMLARGGLVGPSGVDEGVDPEKRWLI